MVLLSDDSSTISSLSSDSPEADNDYDSPLPPDEPSLPPPKRQKIGTDSRASSAVHLEPEQSEPEPDLEGDISTDTEGDVPNSPINAKLDEEEFQEQVTVCAWDGCRVGELRNMDNLVEHIHNDHIENRQKKYTCEWIGCARKSMPHASGYALKAHMRSHTREKPFYCYLPECDRAFTRSDALAKHMRTVHETEALRPSDPVPKSMSGSGKGSKLKIILKTQSAHGGDHESTDDGDAAEEISAELFTPLTEEQGFTAQERQRDVESLWKLCVAQVRWASEETEELREQCKRAEEAYHQEWLEKEVLLDQVKKIEEDWHQRREAVLRGQADIQISKPLQSHELADDRAVLEANDDETEVDSGARDTTITDLEAPEPMQAD